MQTPADWKPPQVWTPPAHLSIPSQPLKYGAAAATGFSCLPALISIVVLAISGGAVFFATGGSLPFFGKVDRWDGASTLRCDMNEHLVLDGLTANVSGPVIDASGLNCHVTIRSSRLTGTVVVQGGTNTEVVIEDSVLEASDRAVVGTMNAKVQVRGQSTVSGNVAAIDGSQNLRVEVDGPARLLSQGDGIRGSQNAEVWLRGGASIESLVPRHKFDDHPLAAGYLAWVEKRRAEFDWEAAVQKLVEKTFKDCNVKFNDNVLTIKPSGKDSNLNEIYKIKENCKKVHLSGVKDVKQVLPVRQGEEFIVITAGSNLKAVKQLEFVDPTRTSTNNIYEVAKELGIEAARQTIINEVLKVIESQGLNVDSRHIMLVADMMCNSGEVKGITRYGVVSEKSSVLARASFETPIRHIINAALVGEEDRLTSVVENVMLNQPVPVGTGLPGLIVKIKGEKS